MGYGPFGGQFVLRIHAYGYESQLQPAGYRQRYPAVFIPGSVPRYMFIYKVML